MFLPSNTLMRVSNNCLGTPASKVEGISSRLHSRSAHQVGVAWVIAQRFETRFPSGPSQTATVILKNFFQPGKCLIPVTKTRVNGRDVYRGRFVPFVPFLELF